MIYLVEYNNKIYKMHTNYTVSRRIAKQVLIITFLVAIHLLRGSFVNIFKSTLENVATQFQSSLEQKQHKNMEQHNVVS